MEKKNEELTTEEVIDLIVKDNSEQEQAEREEKQAKKKKVSVRIYNIVRVFALTIAAGVLVYASYSLTNSYLNYKEDEAKYARINEMFVQEEKKVEKTDDKRLEYSASDSEWVWDYEAMLKYNDEAKGYIKLEGTRIQYPIVEHDDNEFYLTRGSDKISNGAGSIFLDYRTAGLDGKMCILYGHNMLDGSMFKGLMDYRKSDFCKKHPTFDIYVGYRHYIYYAFSTFAVKDDNEDVYKFGFENDSEFSSWIDRVYSRSSYRFDCDKPDISDKIVMLSTCIDDDGLRQVVCLYRGEEVVN